MISTSTTSITPDGLSSWQRRARHSPPRLGAQPLGKSATGLAIATTTLAGANGCRLLISATPARHGPVGIEAISGDVVG
jgi:hypothetical protein